MLKVENLNVYYGAIHAVHNINLEVKQGEVISLIGANGAGKTTILHSISSLKTPESGTTTFLGDNITKTEPHKILTKGMAHVPEGRRIFLQMTVEENLDMGAYTRNDQAEIQQIKKTIFERFPRLEERKTQIAGTLSGGEQQMLAIGRALMSSPKLLLLDEPSMGLAPILVSEIFTLITDLNKQGMTILLVEQNAKMALSVSNRAYVLETGNIVLTGKSSELLNNEEVKKAYLGH